MGGIRLYPQPASLWRPEDHGYLTWNYDPALANNATLQSTVAAAGVLTFARVPMPKATRVTNLILMLTSVGATLTAGQCFAALYTAAGTRVGVTADQSSAWATGTGAKVMALATPYDPPDASDLYVAWWYNGTTAPTWGRSAQQSGASNPGLSAPNLRFGTADTGLTTTAPSPMGAQTGINTTWWAALS